MIVNTSGAYGPILGKRRRATGVTRSCEVFVLVSDACWAAR
jgi:hypothetical protein